MDRDLDRAFRFKKQLKRLSISAVVISAIVLFYLRGPELLQPTISRAQIRTARVDQGAIEATISASGVVLAEFEHVLPSPVNSRVVKILKRPGDAVKAGEPLVELDVSEPRLTLDKLTQQIELKQNQQEKARLDLESTLINLKSQIEIKSLEYRAHKNVSARNRELFKKGLLSEDLLRQSELQEEKTGHELKQLEEAKENALRINRTLLAGLELEMHTLVKERIEAERQLELATMKSDRDGILTWVVTEEGGAVTKGAVLARVANLTSFRVEATISDVHADKLRIGQPVNVKINDTMLSGAIGNILPTIKDGVITIVIQLAERSSPLLKANLRVDVFIVTERKERVLRVQKGPFANAEGYREVFVIRGDQALKTRVQFGISSFDSFEVTEGLLAGDEVIISQMNDYLHLKSVKIK